MTLSQEHCREVVHHLFPVMLSQLSLCTYSKCVAFDLAYDGFIAF